MYNRLLSFAFVFLMLVAPHSSASAFASEDMPKKVVEWVDAYQDFDVDRFLAFYAENVSFKDPTAQIEFPNKQTLADAYRPIMQGRWGGDFRLDIRTVVESGNTVVMEGLFSLTFNGTTAKINFTTWLGFEDGLIVRQLDLFDYAALRRQIPNYGQGIPTEYTGPRD